MIFSSQFADLYEPFRERCSLVLPVVKNNMKGAFRTVKWGVIYGGERDKSCIEPSRPIIWGIIRVSYFLVKHTFPNL